MIPLLSIETNRKPSLDNSAQSKCEIREGVVTRGAMPAEEMSHPYPTPNPTTTSGPPKPVSYSALSASEESALLAILMEVHRGRSIETLLVGCRLNLVALPSIYPQLGLKLLLRASGTSLSDVLV